MAKQKTVENKPQEAAKSAQSKEVNPTDRMVHFTVERVRHDSRTGKRISKPKTLVKHPEAFRRFEKNAKKHLGYEVKVIQKPKV